MVRDGPTLPDDSGTVPEPNVIGGSNRDREIVSLLDEKLATWSSSIYIYIYICVCVCVSICICICIYIYIYIVFGMCRRIDMGSLLPPHLKKLYLMCSDLDQYHENNLGVQSNLVNTTLFYTTPSILQHVFARPNFLVQNSLFYTTTTLDNVTFRISV
jgi:hypothetical protein